MMGYSAMPTTDMFGNPYSEYAPENMSTGGLGSIIRTAKDIGTISYKEEVLSKLFDNKYSLVAFEMARDFNLHAGTVVEYGSSKGFNCVRYNDIEYREKKGKIVVI